MKTIEMKDVKVGEREEWLEKMGKNGEKMITKGREDDEDENIEKNDKGG